MVKKTIALCAILVLVFLAWLVLPSFYHMGISRLRESENGLPKVTVESGGIVYCRMQADDFRFQLPAGSHPQPPVLQSGGFDTVDGNIDVNLDGVTLRALEEFERQHLQAGALVETSSIPGGLAIHFTYFGDR